MSGANLPNMPRRKKRLDRKLHKRHVQDAVELSQVPAWRLRLFATPLYEPLPIDAQHMEGLPNYAARFVRRYGLQFVVYRVPYCDVKAEWLGWEGYEFFRFQACRYPDIFTVSANNPDWP